MATRFYFDNALVPYGGDPTNAGPFYFGAQSNAGVDAGWEDTFGFSLVPAGSLVPKTQVGAYSTLTDATKTATTTGTRDAIWKQFVSPVLSIGGIISGTFSFVMRCAETNLTDNANLAVVVRLCANDGTARATLLASYGVDTEFAITASAATRIINAATLTQATAYPGDHIVIEVGTHYTVSTTNGNITFRTGISTSADFALTTALTTDLNPWCEFSQNLFPGLDNNHKFLKVGNGMSVGEKIR